MANVITYGVTLDASGAINGFKRLDAAIDGAQTSATGLGGAMSGLGARFLSVAGITAGLTLAVRKFVTETSEAQAAQAQLTAALVSTRGASGQTLASLNAFAEAMQRTTTYSDDAVNAMQSTLLVFDRLSGAVFPRAAKATLDLATRMGRDLQGAALALGRALQDPVGGLAGLSRAGVTFTDAQESLIKSLVETNRLMDAQVMILTALESKVGGSAAADVTTLGGAFKRLGNEIGEAFEGPDGAGGLTGLVESLTTFLRASREMEARADGWWQSRFGFGGPAATPEPRVAGLPSPDPYQVIRDIRAERDAALQRIAAEAAARKAAWLDDRAQADERAGWEKEELARLRTRTILLDPAGLAARGAGRAGGRDPFAPIGLPPGFGQNLPTPGTDADAREAAYRAQRDLLDQQLRAEAQITENFLRGVQGNFANFFATVFTDGMQSFRGLMDGFKTLVVQTIAELAAKRLMDRIFTAGAGAGFFANPLVAGAAVIAGIFGLSRSRRPRAAPRPAPVVEPVEESATDRANLIRQSVGGVLTETSASRIVGNLESIRVGIFQLVALAQQEASRGAGLGATATIDRLLGGRAQSLRLSAGTAVLP